MDSQPAPPRAAPESPPRRLGPRPLPMHLMAAGLTWAASRSALPLWNSGSLPWKGELADRAAALRESLNGTDLAAFDMAVGREVAGRLQALAAGIEAYRARVAGLLPQLAGQSETEAQREGEPA